MTWTTNANSKVESASRLPEDNNFTGKQISKISLQSLEQSLIFSRLPAKPRNDPHNQRKH